ncbi:MAG: hypothetical protein PHV42_03080 [Candidatus Pacebacteria bacterium]|nr:hypothetical protein [Candidatus Paceibacterota bacterium]
MPSSISRLHGKFGDGVMISVHCHNDLGLGVANTLAGLKNGARIFQGTINGIGERAGNVAIEEVVAALYARTDYYRLFTNIDKVKIGSLSRLVSSATETTVAENKPVVGKNMARHESGIHVHGMLQDENTYQIVKPETYGMDAVSFHLGATSGKAGIKARLKELKYELTHDETERVIKSVFEWLETNAKISDLELEEIAHSILEPPPIVWTFEDKKCVREGEFEIVALTLKKDGKSLPPHTVSSPTAEGALIRLLDRIVNNSIVETYSLSSSPVREGVVRFRSAVIDNSLGLTRFYPSSPKRGNMGPERITDLSPTSVWLGILRGKSEEGEKTFHGLSFNQDVQMGLIEAYLIAANRVEYYLHTGGEPHIGV